MHIEIKDNTVEIKSGNARATGKAYTINEQTAYLVTQDERKRIVLSLRNGQTPYAVGRYLIASDSFVVDQFGGLKIGRLSLTPATPQEQRGLPAKAG